MRPVALAKNMTFARSYLSYCLHEHTSCHFRGRGCACKAEASKPRLPTRVVDVDPPLMPLNPSLLETNRQQDDYLTLSYCWGQTEMGRTTSETLSDYRASIPLDVLAKTIRDAFITTKELGYNYIWIDSLCIIQGCKEDWERESSRMAMIYRHSTLTIAASGARLADEGCFLSRIPSLQCNCHIILEKETKPVTPTSRIPQTCPPCTETWSTDLSHIALALCRNTCCLAASYFTARGHCAGAATSDNAAKNVEISHRLIPASFWAGRRMD